MPVLEERRPSRVFRRYLSKSRKRRGGLICLRCEGRFGGRDAYDRHLVWYSEGITDSGGPGEWCQLPEEVGLVGTPGGWWRLPAVGELELDPWIEAGGGIPRFPRLAEYVSDGNSEPGGAKRVEVEDALVGVAG